MAKGLRGAAGLGIVLLLGIGAGAAAAGDEQASAPAPAQAGTDGCQGNKFGSRNILRRLPLEGPVTKPPYEGFWRAMNRAAQYGYRHPEAFAEHYGRRTAHGQVVHIGFARRLRHHRRAVLNILPRPNNVRFFKARFTVARLERIQRRIGQQLMWTDEPAPDLGTKVSGTDINVKRNVILIFVEEFSCRVRRELRQRYGPRNVWVPAQDVVVWPQTGSG